VDPYVHRPERRVVVVSRRTHPIGNLVGLADQVADVAVVPLARACYGGLKQHRPVHRPIGLGLKVRLEASGNGHVQGVGRIDPPHRKERVGHAVRRGSRQQLIGCFLRDRDPPVAGDPREIELTQLPRRRRSDLVRLR
jgi:hypothetical protein